MHHWSFVIAAYAVTAIGTAALCVASYRAMRAAESAAEALSDRA